MKWLDSLIQKTECYKRLFREVSFATHQCDKLRFMYDEQHKHLLENINNVDNLTKQILRNKTIARKIVRLTNSLLKKEELVMAKKQIQSYCHEIIKGEN